MRARHRRGLTAAASRGSSQRAFSSSGRCTGRRRAFRLLQNSSPASAGSNGPPGAVDRCPCRRDRRARIDRLADFRARTDTSVCSARIGRLRFRLAPLRGHLHRIARRRRPRGSARSERRPAARRHLRRRRAACGCGGGSAGARRGGQRGAGGAARQRAARAWQCRLRAAAQSHALAVGPIRTDRDRLHARLRLVVGSRRPDAASAVDAACADGGAGVATRLGIGDGSRRAAGARRRHRDRLLFARHHPLVAGGSPTRSWIGLRFGSCSRRGHDLARRRCRP